MQAYRGLCLCVTSSGSICYEIGIILVYEHFSDGHWIMSLCTGAFTGFFGPSFSRNLSNNQLTGLPEGLLNTTTQLQFL